jgi:hypothetical protein
MYQAEEGLQQINKQPCGRHQYSLHTLYTVLFCIDAPKPTNKYLHLWKENVIIFSKNFMNVE